jgi:TRAP-type C4-dicarboxylate transport system substrate-binding protein
VCLIVIGVGQVGAAPIVLRFGVIQSVTDATTRAMMQLAEQVEKESNGRLKIEVYPASQLGDAVSQIEGVMMGSLEMFCDAGEWCSQFVKDWNVMAFTFVFDDEAHLRKFLAPSYPSLRRLL